MENRKLLTGNERRLLTQDIFHEKHIYLMATHIYHKYQRLAEKFALDSKIFRSFTFSFQKLISHNKMGMYLVI